MEFLRNLSERIPFLKQSRPLRYLIAGGTGAAVNFSILYALTEYAHIWYLLSATVAYVFAFVVSFILQKFWTFQNMQLEHISVQMALHITLSLSNIVAGVVLLFVFVEYVGIWYMFGQFISAALLACANYFIYRFHIFPESAVS